jgi:hypothetical protein
MITTATFLIFHRKRPYDISFIYTEWYRVRHVLNQPLPRSHYSTIEFYKESVVEGYIRSMSYCSSTSDRWIFSGDSTIKRMSYSNIRNDISKL